LVKEVAVTADRPMPDGLGTCFQLVPFQCRISEPLVSEPTAQALLEEVAATPDRLPPGGLGLSTCCHSMPFQCRISKPRPPPTAQALRAEVAATADR
jgi:hypothetical protein